MDKRTKKQQRHQFELATQARRIQRRIAELAVVEGSFRRGNRPIFCPGFSIDSVIEAREYVTQQNQLDEAGRINTDFAGRPLQRRVRDEDGDEFPDALDGPENPAADATFEKERFREAIGSRGPQECGQRPEAGHGSQTERGGTS